MLVRPMPRWLHISRIGQYLFAWWVRERVPAEPFPSEAEVALWRSRLAAGLIHHDGDERNDIAAFHERVLQYFDDWGSVWSDDVWREVLEPAFAAAKRLAVGQGVRLAVAVMPVSYQVQSQFLDDQPQRRAVNVARALGLPILDLLPALREAYRISADPPLFYDNCHHTPRGAEVVAQALTPFVAGLLPER